MSDPLQTAYLQRARSALDMAAQSAPDTRAKAFADIAFTMLKSRDNQSARDALEHHADPQVVKAAASLLDSDWQHADAATLAAAYVATIAESSLLDQIARYARPIPANVSHVLVASDAVGDTVAEGLPKPIIQQGLDAPEADPIKSVAIVVLSAELARASGGEGRRLFESELRQAVLRASNAAVLANLIDSNTLTVSGTGDPLDDLRAGLQAAGASEGYVVATTEAQAADLATRVENRSMSVRGGEFVPGILIVPVYGASGMTVIPASRLALRDYGLAVRSSEVASLDMRDTPQSPAIQTSLWQTNCVGLIAERAFHLAGDTTGIVTVLAGS